MKIVETSQMLSSADPANAALRAIGLSVPLRDLDSFRITTRLFLSEDWVHE